MWWDVSGMSIIMHSSLQKERSSLMEACSNGNAAVVEKLLSKGADAHVNDQDEVSSTSPAE